MSALTGRMFRTWLMGIVACRFLTGCLMGPDYHSIETKMPAGFISMSSSKHSALSQINQPVIDAAKWWQALNDPQLNELIDRAIIDNFDLEVALDRIQEARTQEYVVMGAALPEAGASIGGAAGTGSDLARGRVAQSLVSAENTGSLQQVTHIAGFDAGWELDLFGKYRRGMEAAKYNTEAATAARNAVLISIIADVARAYVDMRAFQMQLFVLQKNIDTLHEYFILTKERFDRGITNELDVTMAQRQLASLEAEKAPLVSRIHAAQYVIAVLVGRFPEDVAPSLEKPGMMPQLPEKIEAGLPLDLLRRRPDIQQAERDVAGATAQIGMATADLFPLVSLTGSAGIQGKGLGAKAFSSFIWSSGPSLSWPLLDFGSLDALVAIADLRAKEMLAHYRQSVLEAVREVDTSVESYAAQQDRLRNLDTALAASQRAVSIATQRYDRGLTDALNVIDAERQEYDLEQQYVYTQQSAAEQFIALFKALGGGWELYQSFPPIHRPQPAVLAAFKRLLGSDDPQKK
jgi:NodT family efflux transporter outer membrane factor (OMF) lipoprotein